MMFEIWIAWELQKVPADFGAAKSAGTF